MRRWVGALALVACSGSTKVHDASGSGGVGGTAAGSGGSAGHSGASSSGGHAGGATSGGDTGASGAAGAPEQAGSGGAAGSVAEAGSPGSAGAPEPPAPLPRTPALDARFVKITLHREFYCEGASYGDFNRDGVTDVVAGPDWYEGPGFGASHPVWAHSAFDPHGYSDCFFEWVRDLDADGWPDILMVGFPGTPAAWFENPGKPDGTWTRHDVIQSPVDNESPAFVDLTGDGEPELVHMTSGVFGWSAPDAGVSEPWVFHALSDNRGYPTFTHGLGVGDLDGDGRAEAIEASGYFTQPASLAADPPWSRVEQSFGGGGAQMPVLDLDGDGDMDVVSSLAAHGYGLAWFEQTGATPTASFSEHVIVPDAVPPPDDAAVTIHEPHAVAVADIDGDGVDDLVTGERFWGHIPAGMPDFSERARIYWFHTERNADGVTFTPTLIDDDSGVGTQLTVGDIDGDDKPDIVIANKKGAFVFLQH